MIVNVFEPLSGLVTAKLPAPTVALARTVWVPKPSAIGTVKDQAPLPLAEVVPTTMPSSHTLTAAFGAVLPEMTGVVALIWLPWLGDVIVGAANAHTLPPHAAPTGQSALDTQRTHVPVVVLQAGVFPAHVTHDVPQAAATLHAVQLASLHLTGSETMSENTALEPFTPAGSASMRSALFDDPHAKRKTELEPNPGEPLAAGGFRIVASGIAQSRK